MVHEHTRIDKWIHAVLFLGMVLSITIMVVGLVLYSFTPTGHPEVDLGPGGILSGLGQGNPIAVIDLGIVLLILTPLSRVITALVVFIVDREPRFVLTSLIVLAILALAILVG
jgi:uncharacterized membrane protein